MPSKQICNDTLECLFAINFFMMNYSVTTFDQSDKLNATKSFSTAIYQEWISYPLFQLLTIFLFLDVTVIAIGMILEWVGIMKYLESATKFVIFVLTTATVITAVVIHQDDPFGPMFNVICGLITIFSYCYLMFFHVEISHQKLKVHKYSVI
jgi:hypothetical protein